MQKKLKRGISVVELVVASAIILAVTSVVFSSYTLTSRLALQNTPFLQASLLAEEGTEAIRVMRDFGWSANIASLTSGATYRFYFNGSTWVSTTTVSMIDGVFDRTFVLSDVNRDAGFNIVTSGGNPDAGAKKVTVSVAWKNGLSTTTKSVESYIFNTFNN